MSTEALKIEKDRVVRFHYTVSEPGQEPLETSKERDPLAILVGHGNVIPGLDKALEGHVAGDSFGVDVAAADAYGERRDGLTQRVPKKHFREQKLAPIRAHMARGGILQRAADGQGTGRVQLARTPSDTEPKRGCRPKPQCDGLTLKRVRNANPPETQTRLKRNCARNRFTPLS